MSASKPANGTLSLQPRDIALLRGLFESRVMTAGHAATLHFNGRDEMTKKRLQKLKAAGLVGERKRLVNEPAVLFIARKGLETLREQGVLAEYPSFDLPVLEKRARVSDITIRHELEVMDVKTAFHAVVASNDSLSIAEFGTWPLLNEFVAFSADGNEVLVRPDGFIRIHEKEADGGLSEHAFYLEVDRSTETQDTLIARAVCYLNHYKSGGYAVRNGAPRSAFKEYPFRVLMVFKTAERRNNMAERLLSNIPPIFTHVYLTTLAEVTRDPCGAVWIRPIDYRDAVTDTPFAPRGDRQQRPYQRQAAREMFVEQAVKKTRLLT